MTRGHDVTNQTVLSLPQGEGGPLAVDEGQSLRRLRSAFERTDNIADCSLVVQSTEDHTTN